MQSTQGYDFVAMVNTDNKVALRQLEIANAALLSRTSLHISEGESIAKDGKFHPRVLTLVRSNSYIVYLSTLR